MKMPMMMVAATMAFAAFADEPPAPPSGGNAPAAAAQRLPRRPDRPPMMNGGGVADPLYRAVMNPRVVEKIGLSEDQKSKLAALRADRNANEDLQEKVRAGMNRQVELLKAEKIDEAAVMQAVDEVFEARKQMAKAQTKRVIAVRSILTPEQAAKALEEMKAGRGFRARGNGPRVKGPREAGPKGNGSERGGEGRPSKEPPAK